MFTGATAWRGTGLAIVRILFGFVFAIDAWFKWKPAFFNDFYDYVHGAMEGQPAFVKAWVHFWCFVVGINPHHIALVTAIVETLVAVGLILGVFSTLTDFAGAALTFGIWAVAEGFGGPYGPGSMHIGTAIIYVFVFAALWLAGSGLYVGLDRNLGPRLGRWSWLASGKAVS